MGQINTILTHFDHKKEKEKDKDMNEQGEKQGDAQGDAQEQAQEKALSVYLQRQQFQKMHQQKLLRQTSLIPKIIP